MSKSNLNASAEAKKRLLRDLKEIHTHPLENVTAAPVSDSNLFVWHANCMLYKHTISIEVLICLNSAWGRFRNEGNFPLHVRLSYNLPPQSSHCDYVYPAAASQCFPRQVWCHCSLSPPFPSLPLLLFYLVYNFSSIF
jgi:hypothetical protein